MFQLVLHFEETPFSASCKHFISSRFYPSISSQSMKRRRKCGMTTACHRNISDLVLLDKKSAGEIRKTLRTMLTDSERRQALIQELIKSNNQLKWVKWGAFFSRFEFYSKWKAVQYVSFISCSHCKLLLKLGKQHLWFIWGLFNCSVDSDVILSFKLSALDIRHFN